MGTSETVICNIALGLAGQGSIDSLADSNNRAITCATFYKMEILSLLSANDWSFARKYACIPLIDGAATEPGKVAYAVPSDCLTPRYLNKVPSRQNWEIMGNFIVCPDNGDETKDLIYTSANADISVGNSEFIQLAALSLSVKLATALAQDKGLANALLNRFELYKMDVLENDANIGNTYREDDQDPELDTFVRPDVHLTLGNYNENR